MNIDLLLDIEKLRGRYSSEDWAKLAVALKDETTRKNLVEIAEMLSATSANKKRSFRKTSIVREFQKLEDSEPEKAEMLKRLRASLLSREICGTNQELLEFATHFGIKIPPIKKRETSVNNLVRAISDLSLARLKEKVASLRFERHDNSGEYKNWTRIILGRDNGEQAA